MTEVNDLLDFDFFDALQALGSVQEAFEQGDKADAAMFVLIDGEFADQFGDMLQEIDLVFEVAEIIATEAEWCVVKDDKDLWLHVQHHLHRIVKRVDLFCMEAIKRDGTMQQLREARQQKGKNNEDA
jgi:hypothetical protein